MSSPKIDPDLMIKRFTATAALLLSSTPWTSNFAQPPANQAVLGVPLRPPGGEGWQLQWTSVPGLPYQLQRSHDLREWSEVASLTAAGPVTTANDPTVAPEQRTFWRVIQLGNGPDLTPPTLSVIQVRLRTLDGQPALELAVRVQDNVGVAEVGFIETGDSWVGATPETPQTFVRTFPFNPSDSQPRQFQARATDAAGNVGFSEVFAFAPAPPIPGLVSLDLSGNAASQGLIGTRADGSLTPFVYAPRQAGGASPDAGPQMVFPDGARVVEQGGQTYLEYHSLQFRFGWQSALQIAAPTDIAGTQNGLRLANRVRLAADGGASTTDALSVELPAGETARLPVGPVTVAQLEEAFGLPPGSGLPLRLFERFPLRLLSGTLADDSVQGANWGLDQLGLPLPPFTGSWAGSVFRLLTTGEGRFPLYGDLPLTGLGDGAPTLTIARSRPLVLTLRADGQVSLEGPACLTFPSGMKYCVGVTLNDPKYCLSLRAEGLTVPLIDSLADLLPDDPAACIPTLSTDAALDTAEPCLVSFLRAYTQFAQAALTVRPDAAEDEDALIPPGTINALSAVTDAWVASAVIPAVQALPLQELRDAAAHLGPSARGATDAPTVARYLAALVRLRAAVDTYAEKTPPNGDEIPGVRAELDTAIAVAVEALGDRSRDPDAISSLTATQSILEDLREVRLLAASFNPGQTEALNAIRDRIVDGFWTRFTAALGIRPDVFDHHSNPVVNALNRFAALEEVHQLNDFLGAAQAVDRNPDSLPLLEETVEQLFGRAFQVVLDNFDTAVAGENVPAGLIAMRELLDLIAQWELQSLDDGDEDFPTLADALLRFAELNAVFEAQATLPRDQQSLLNNALRVRALLAVLESVPPETTIPFVAITGAHDDLQEALALALGLAPANDRLDELFEILRAGALYTRMGLRFDLSNAIDWEATHLPVIVQRLGEVAAAQKALAPLEQAVRFLLEEGDALEAEAARLAAAGNPAANTRQASRRLYYLQAAALLNQTRSLATQLWIEAESRRAAAPDEFSADAFLPGDLKIDAIAGTVCFNHATRRLTGAFNGRLRLPKLDSSLTIANASISNEGDFDLNAHGQLQLPGGTPAATLTIPARQPLHISHHPRDGLGVAGKARLEFANGVFFETGVNFNDPLYSFELAAGGIEVDLAKALAAVLPLGLEPEDLANLARGQLWSDYFTFLTACFETGYRPENEIDPLIPGTVPAFTGRAASDISCLLDAWSCLMLAEAERGTLDRYRSTYEKVGEVLALLDRSLQEGSTGFATLFGPANEFEIGYQLRRLQKLALTYAKVSRALKAIVDNDPTGAAAIDLTQVKAHLDQGATLWLGVANKLDDNVDLLRNRAAVEVVVRAGLDLVAAYQILGFDTTTGLSLSQIASFLDAAATELAATVGLNRANGTVNTSLITGFTYDRAQESIREHLDTVADLQLVGIDEPISTPLLTALLNRLRDLALADLGFQSATGQFELATVTDETIQRGLSRLAELPAAFAIADVPGPAFPAAFAALGSSLQQRFLGRDDDLPASRWPARKALLFALLRLEDLREFAGLPALLDPAFDFRLLSLLQQMLAEGRGRLSTDEQEVLDFLAPGLAAHFLWAPPLRERLATAAFALDAETTRAWSEGDLNQASALTRELLALDRLTSLDTALHLPGPHTAASILGSLTGRLEATGRAAQRAKPLSEVAALYLQAADDPAHLPLAAELHGRATQLLNAAREIADGYALQLDELAETDQPLDFHLPQDLRIARVFGSVFYRRDTGFLQGTLGGRLEFPNEKAFFDITQATLNSDGGFALKASTQFPLQPTGDDRVQINANLDLAGNRTTLTNLTGTGQLTLKESPTLTQTYGITVTYDGLDPARPLRFRADLDGIENADSLRFSDDFVLFGGHLIAELSLANAGEFALGFGGRAGFFTRREPLTEPVTRDDFWVFADVTQLGVRQRADAFIATFSGGSLTLAEDFFSALEEVPGGDLIPIDGPVTIPVPFAFSVGYNFAEGRPVFALGNGDAVGGASIALAAPGLPPLEPVQFDLPPLAFGIPGLTNSQIRVHTCQLEFFADRFPILRNLDARFSFPLPGSDFADPDEHGIADIQLSGENWRVDGFPDAAAINLQQDLRVVSTDGFDLDLLAGTGMSFESAVNAGQRTTAFTLTGGLRGTVDGDLLFDAENNAAFAFATSGSLRWDIVNLPTFTLDAVTFSGRLKLGGSSGFELIGVTPTGIPDPDSPDSLAFVTLTGLPNLFQLSAERPFEITVSGALGSADFLYFGLGNARFRFDGVASAANPEPQFLVQSLGFREGENLSLLGLDALPLRITAGSITFLDPARPLNQLFAVDNLQFTLSGEVNLSLSSPDAESPDSPRLFGAVDNVIVSLPDGFAGPPQFSLNTLVLTLENLTIGDLAGLTGGLAVGNLQNPSELFFAGTAGGGFNGVAVKAIVATRLDGLIGLCLAVNAGPAGIPLDGGSLGGILLTGAEGGVSFANEFADPCDFKSFLRLADDGTPTNSEEPPATPAGPLAPASLRSPPPPVIPVSHLNVLTWDELARQQELHEQRQAVRALLSQSSPTDSAASPRRVSASPRLRVSNNSPALADEGGDIPCPTGDCPPATINLLCQRHPSIDEEPSAANYDGRYRNQVIFKFSSLNSEVVDDLLAALDLDLSGPTDVVAGRFADGTREFIDSLLPRPGAGLPAEQAAEINAFLDNGLAAMRDALAAAAEVGLALAAGEGRTPLEAIYEVAYAGVPCVDLTLQLKGTFSYAPVSVAVSATGGAVVSTTGTAGILGSVNLFAIPVGTGEFFYSATDSNGDPNPSLCGGVRVALGPLDLSQLGLAIGCDDCITGTLEALAAFVSGLTGDVLTEASPILYAFIEQAAGTRLTGIPGRPLTDFFGPPSTGALLTQQEQVAVLAALLNLPEVARFLEANPAAISEFNRDALVALASRSVGLLLEIYNRAEPRFSMCGEIEPKLFGFSLTGGNTLAAARLAADKTRIAGDVSFSPSYIFGNLPFFLLSSGSLNNVVPALDEATLGFSLGLPLFNQTVLNQLAADPAAFASTQVDHLLANAVLTFGYELSPFGFKIADGEGRISLPTLGDHPDNPARRAARPRDYDATGRFVAPAFPSRDDVLKAALDANRLAQATWEGRGTQLAELFPAGSAEAAALAGRELARDYFPHGGFLGASKVQFPKPITDAPPFDQLNTLVAADTDLVQRLTLALDLFNNYLLGSREIGQLMVYVPFARPPEAFWAVPQGPQAFIDAIRQITPDHLLSEGLHLYPAEQLFMRGDVNAQILGLPVGEGELVADPAQGLFRLTAGVPEGTWLHDFVQGNLAFEIKTAAYLLEHDPSQLPPGTSTADLQPEARLQAALNLLLTATGVGTTAAQKQAALDAAIARITDTLPKVSLNTDLNLQLPESVRDVLQFNSGAGFHAFSPRFEPDYALPGFTGTLLYPDPDPSNPGPYTLARRNGGVVAVGHFQFGFNLSDPDPTRRFVIDVPEAALAVTGASSPSAFPALAGRVRVDEITLPGTFTFGGLSTPPFRFRNGLLQFNSAPPAGADFLAIAGQLTPIDLGPFLRVRPLPAEANPENLLGGTLRVTRPATGSATQYALSLNAAAVSIPMLGESLRGTIFGSQTGPGRFTPFSFSTAPGQPWNATLSLNGALEIRSPLDPTGPVVFRAEPLRVGGAPVPFLAEVQGTGLEEFEVRVTIPNGLGFTLFPGTGHEGRFTTGAESATCLFVRSDGRLYFDSGTRTLDLNGLATTTGRIEFGFEPVDRTPVLVHTTPASFSTRLGRSQLQTVKVSNNNRAGGQLIVDAAANDPLNFTVLPNRLVLGPGESGDLSVRFTPKQTGTFSRQLTLTNNSAQPLVVIPLAANAITAPRMHVSVAAINFGSTPLGTTRSQPVRISNLGDATLNLSSIKTSTARFTADRTSLLVPAGQARDILVEFHPASTPGASDALTFSSNDPDAPAGVVTLTGSGSNQFWYRQRRGTGHEDLQGIAMKADDTGVAIGRRGAFLRAQARGRSWSEDFRPDAPDLRDLVFTTATSGWLVGAQGMVFRTFDGGLNWTRQNSTLISQSDIHWRDAAPIDPASGVVAFVGEAKAFGYLVFGPSTASLTQGVIPSKTPPLNGVAFSSKTTGLAVGEEATVLRSTDGGKTWQRLALPDAVSKTARLRAVAASDSSAATFVVVGDDGLILRTTDTGATWTIRTSSTTEDLHAVVRAGSAFYAAGDNGVIRRGSSSGLSWTVEDARTTADLRALTSLSGEVWAVSTDGDVFHRLTTAIGGPLAVVTTSDLDFGEVGDGERVIGEITVANEGTQSLDVTLDTDFPERVEVTPKEKQSIAPGCQTVFAVRLTAPAGGTTAKVAITSSDATTSKLNLVANAIGRKKDFTPLAYAGLPGCLDLGALNAGDEAKTEFTIENLGDAPLEIHGITARTEDPRDRFEFRTPFAQLAPGERGVIEVGFTSVRPGQRRTRIEVASNARNGIADFEFLAEILTPPEVIVLDTVPRGVPLVVNGASVTTPAAFTVVDGTPTAGQFQREKVVTVAPPASHSIDGVPYAFQRWNPGRQATLTFTPGDSAARYTAQYAQTLAAGGKVTEPPVIKSPCLFTPPEDVAFGPWVKISQARLTVPWLGDTAAGTDFAVDGALFLSLTRAYGSLASSRVRVAVPNTAPHFGGTELLEITPGSWSFDVESGFFRLRSLTPGLQVLNASTLPPASLLVEVDARAASADRRALARFATLDELPLAPGLLAVGPSSAEVRLGLNPAQPDARLALAGSLRALARPEGNGWLVNRPYTLALDASLPALAPLTFSSRTLLADLALVRVHAESGSVIGPTLVGSTFGLTASGLSLELFGNGQPFTASATVLADGSFNLQGGFPSGLNAGPVRLLPHPAGDGIARIALNPLQARLAVTLPRVRIHSTASTPVWPNNTIDLPGFTFDSENFAVRIPLPTVTFAGFDVKSQTSADADNYFEFARGTGGSRVALRNRQDLFIGAMQFGFTLEPSVGDLTGHLSGRIGVEEPSPLDVVSDRVSMTYRRSPKPEFVYNRFFFGIGCRLSAGSTAPLAQACVLTPSDKPLADWAPAVCFP